MNENSLNHLDFLTILIVEDDEGLSRLIGKKLRRTGYTVDIANSGKEAVAYVSNNNKVLLLLDYRLQDMTGREVLDHIYDLGVAVPFIIMTGNGDERIAVEMMKLGARDYLVKDQNFLEILPQILEQVFSQLSTERKLEEMERALRESENHFRTLFNSGTDAVLVYQLVDGLPHNFIEVNEIACERLEYTREELLEMKPEEIEDNESADFSMGNVREALANHGDVLYEMSHITKKGKKLPVEINAQLIDFKGKTAVLSIARDITERKHLEAQLRQSHKMEAIGKLAGGVAHDFNNLLTAIMGYSELMLVKMDDNHPYREGVKEIKKAGERAAALTQQLLAFSRKQMLKPKLLDLNKVVTGIEKMLKRIIGENIDFTSKLSPALSQIKADPGQVEQIILNLSVNAGDAMQGGGELIIKTDDILIDDQYCIRSPEARPGRFVCLTISDSGEGMDDGTLQHIFEPFFTTKKVGTGLGLSVVYGIIKQHNGWINVTSEKGVGTTFKIFFPVAIEKSLGETEENVSLNELKGHNERILFVEDEEGVRKITVKALRDYGYHVTEAVTAKEAFEIFENNDGDFVLIFSDIVLADIPGIELVEELQRRKPEVKILLTSGYADKKSRWSDVNKKGIPFLQKPYSLADLLKSVREALT